MSAVSHHDARATVAEVRRHHADFIAAAEQACALRENSRAQRSAARRAGALAAIAAEDVPVLAALLAELLAESEDAHRHTTREHHDALRWCAEVGRLEDEITRLTAELDQVRAELRDTAPESL